MLDDSLEASGGPEVMSTRQKARRPRNPGQAKGRRFYETPIGAAVLGIIPFLVVIGVWQLVASEGGHSLQLTVPPPGKTWTALVHDVRHEQIWTALATTYEEVGLGLAIAGALGICMGLLTGLSSLANAIFWPIVVFFQSVPKVALAPLMIVVLGFGIGSKVAVAAAVAFFPVMVGVAQGARNIRTDEIDLMRSLCASRTQVLLKVRLPRALPSTFAGFQVAVTLALLGAVVTEFIGASNGVGYLIAKRGSTLDVAGMYDAIIILSLVAVFVSLALSFLDRRLSSWTEA